MPTTRYREAVEKYGDNAIAMLDDQVVRQKETELILGFFETHRKSNASWIADIGCGDGYTINRLSEKYQGCPYTFYGIDLTEELLDIARRNRKGENCSFRKGDAASIYFGDNCFDIILTQRCIINLSSWDDQKKALNEIYRVLKPGGHYLMIESFTDGLLNNNKARMECGLPPLKEAPFNKYIDKELFFQEMQDRFSIDGSSYNFLSSHYFISRVLHALVTKGEQMKNTEFVKFFSFLPPIGNYSPIQSFILTKREKE